MVPIFQFLKYFRRPLHGGPTNNFSIGSVMRGILRSGPHNKFGHLRVKGSYLGKSGLTIRSHRKPAHPLYKASQQAN
jgi:hypothetical protein